MKVSVELTKDQNYLLNELLRSHIKDLRDFGDTFETEIAFARRLLNTLATAKIS
jgi:hypothetical protein